MKNHNFMKWMALIVFWICLSPQPSMAYIGPGAGLSAIGAFLAVVAGVIAAIFGFLWYPIKRLIRKWKKTNTTEDNGGSE